MTIVKRTFSVDGSPPVIELVNPGDQDVDGDGFADNRFRPAAFEIPFTAIDDRSGVNASSAACTVSDATTGAAVAAAAVKQISTAEGPRYACAVSNGLDGATVTITLTTADAVGNVARRSISVIFHNDAGEEAG